MRRGFEWTKTIAPAPLTAVLWVWLAGPANADGAAPSNIPAGLASQARCDSLSQGFTALPESDDCRRISGYVAAGGNFALGERIRGPRAPFGPLAPRDIVISVGESTRAIINAQGRPGGAFIPVSRDDLAR
jgi:hypothetical protein